MNTELEARLALESLQADQQDKQQHLSSLDNQLTWAQRLTFCLYLAFAMALYVGDVWNLQTIITSFVSGSFGIVFFGVIAVLLAYVLAGTKHAAYTHFSMYKTVKLVLLVAAFTGIMAEVFNSSGVQDVKARAVTKHDAEYQALSSTSAGAGVQVSSGLAADIARAEQVLERCKVKLAMGKEKHCRGDAAKVQALKDTQQAALSAQIAASSATQAERYKRLDQLKEQAYNPVIRAIADTFGLESGSAVALVMLVFAIVFELMHYYLSVMRRDVIGDLKAMNKPLQVAQVDYLKASGHEYGAAPTPSDNPTENQQRWSVNPAMGASFNTTTAQIGTLATAPTRQAIMATKVSSEPDQASTQSDDRVPKVQPEQPERLPFGFAPSPKPTATAEHPHDQKAGATGKHNPVLGKAEQHYTLPLNEPEQVKAETLSEPLAKGQSGLYNDWIKAVKNQCCKPSVNPTWEWIQKRVSAKETGNKTPDRTKISTMQKAFFNRAIADGYMMKNPNYRNGMKKFLWIQGV